MSIQQAYNLWASQYDTNLNNTRDVEAIALRKTLHNIAFDTCLEIGCGTGKNTIWLLEQAKEITAVDFSKEMLAKAKEKINSSRVTFIQTDITGPWSFKNNYYNLVSFSLVLEHVYDIDTILKNAATVLKQGGFIYIGELHPFKQYAGSKARFETEEGTNFLDCYIHHISEFVNIAKKYKFNIVMIDEFFDNDNKAELPRILCLLLQKI